MAPKCHRYHVRSTSLPSTSHPLTARVEEQLEKLRGLLASAHESADIIQSGFCGLTGLYESVEDLLQSPHTQQVLIQHRHEKWVEKVLDGSLRLLDITGTTRDVLLQMKESVQETQSALRRTRGEVSYLRNETNTSYVLCRKKLSKEIQKCVGDLRKMDNEKHAPSLSDRHEELAAIVSVLRNVEAITLSLFESLLQFLTPSPRLLIGKPSRWSLVSKLIQRRRIACEDHHHHQKEVIMTVENAQRNLQALETSIRGLEEGLECAFRRLIKTRVCLLNILNN